MPEGEQGPVGRGSPWAGPDKYLQLFSSFLASTAPLAGSQSRLFRPGVSSDETSTLCSLTESAGQGWGVLPRLQMAHSLTTVGPVLRHLQC